LVWGPAGPAWADLETGVAAYERGDYETAFKEFKAAAEQGNAEAQNRLGDMYAEGQGVPQDYGEAVKWYRRAAEQGDAKAQFFLGSMYVEGQGVIQDYAEAVKWFRRAADQGDAGAQGSLGFMYLLGRGVPQDYQLAYMWFNLAAAGATDKDARDMAAKNRDLVAEKLTPAQLAEAQKWAREWKPEAEK